MGEDEATVNSLPRRFLHKGLWDGRSAGAALEKKWPNRAELMIESRQRIRFGAIVSTSAPKMRLADNRREYWGGGKFGRVVFESGRMKGEQNASI